jgi:hypothetical protein
MATPKVLKCTAHSTACKDLTQFFLIYFSCDTCQVSHKKEK